MTRRELDGRVPLIGFAGAPFTLASYAIEGGPSRDFARTKALMYGHPEAWHRLCDAAGRRWSAPSSSPRSKPGAQAIQIFDSWVGALSAEDYREFASPHTAAVFEALKPTGVPTIHFGTGTSTILTDLAAAGGDVIGVDWRLPIDVAWEQLGTERAVQGNLDPTLLLGPRHRLLRAAEDVLRARRPGGPATSSTSATASCPRRRSSTSRCSPGSCTGTAPPDGHRRGRRPRPSPSTSPWSAAGSPA